MSASDPHFRLRLPTDLKAAIEQAAQKSKRSINAMIVDALEDYFSKDGRVPRLIDTIAFSTQIQKELATTQRFIAAAYMSAVNLGRMMPVEDFETHFGVGSNLGQLVQELLSGTNKDETGQERLKRAAAELLAIAGEWDRFLEYKLRKGR